MSGAKVKCQTTARRKKSRRMSDYDRGRQDERNAVVEYLRRESTPYASGGLVARTVDGVFCAVALGLAGFFADGKHLQTPKPRPRPVKKGK